MGYTNKTEASLKGYCMAMTFYAANGKQYMTYDSIEFIFWEKVFFYINLCICSYTIFHPCIDVWSYLPFAHILADRWHCHPPVFVSYGDVRQGRLQGHQSQNYKGK